MVAGKLDSRERDIEKRTPDEKGSLVDDGSLEIM